MLAAAMISVHSFQLERTKPPKPRFDLYSLALAGSVTMLAHASTGSLYFARASRHSFSKGFLTFGYFRRFAEYMYQL